MRLEPTLLATYADANATPYDAAPFEEAVERDRSYQTSGAEDAVLRGAPHGAGGPEGGIGRRWRHAECGYLDPGPVGTLRPRVVVDERARRPHAEEHLCLEERDLRAGQLPPLARRKDRESAEELPAAAQRDAGHADTTSPFSVRTASRFETSRRIRSGSALGKRLAISP